MKALLLHLARFPHRVLLFYWLCFVFPFPFDLVGLPFQLVEYKNQPAWMKKPAEYCMQANGWIMQKKHDVCKWVGPYLSDQPVVIQMTGSGDTMRNYVGCFCAGVLAVGLAMVWSILLACLQFMKFTWQGDAWLQEFVRIVVRFFLIQMLFGYGFAKVFPLQFTPPSSFRLTQQLGDMSPMGLLWTMMGFSTPYQMFTGAVEVLGGLLLISRRTTFLGALVTAGAMTQIFALNMCFDVPVKLYSFHYLIMAIFLAAPDLPRLISVMVLGRAAEPRIYPPRLGNLWVDRFALLLRTVVVAVMLYGQISFGYTTWEERYGGPSAPVMGTWETTSLQIDGKDAEPSDMLNWKSIDFSNKSMARITGPKPPMLVYKITWKHEEKKLVLAKFSSPLWSASFDYVLSASENTLVLTGNMDGKAMMVKLKPGTEKKSELTNRGFHWIQEMPYNR